MKAIPYLVCLAVTGSVMPLSYALKYSDLFPTAFEPFTESAPQDATICKPCSTSSPSHNNTCTITIEPHWQNLESTSNRAEQFGGKWILAGTITFKKKCNAPVNLEEITLQWHGDHLENLQGSLFIVKNPETFKPINENHVADSKWGKERQILELKFDHLLNLQSTTVLNLVLTVPTTQEQLLKGHFTIAPQCLPAPFQEAATKDPLAINIDVMKCTID